MRRLKNSSLFKTLENNYFIILSFIILTLLFVFTKKYIFIIIEVAYFIYIFKVLKKLAIIISFVILALILNYVIRMYIYQNTSNINNQIMTVVDISKKEDNYQVTLKYKLNKYISYMENANIGDVYLISGTFKEASTKHFEGGFNYKSYLYSKGISGELEITSYQWIKNRFTLKTIHQKIDNYLDKKLNTSALGMVKALTIGNKNSFDDELYSDISKIGVSHLFVISGLHVGLIASFLSKVFNRFKIKEPLVISALLLYYIICGLSISVFRVVFSYILSLLNKRYNLLFSRVDIISINIIAVLLFNPYFAISYSFLLSYIISTSIILFSAYLKKAKRFKFIKDNIYISLLSIIVTIPVVQQISPDVNLLSIVYNLFYIPFVSYVLLPFSFLLIIVPRLEFIFLLIYNFFSNITYYLSNIKILTITYPNINIYMIIGYYLLIILIFICYEKGKKIRKLVVSFLILNVIWVNASLFNPYSDVTFLDLPKGEATLIKASFNRCNILIDTGESGYDDILIFLKKQGIKRLDFIILSHSDSDHTGMLDEIIDEFRVKNIVINKYDEKTCKSLSKKINIIRLSKNDVLSYKDIYINVLSPSKDYLDSNNNSLVFKLVAFGKRYLFTGDIEKLVEQEIDNIGKVDFLKVAHHGSNTSTTDIFLNKVSFEYAICMNGYRNTFSFPSFNTRQKLGTILYVTSDTGSITIRKSLLFNRIRICY